MTGPTQQQGASSSTPSAIKRWVISKILTRAAIEKRQLALRAKREASRKKEGRRHVVEYFHQVEDGYSHLAIQVLAKLREQYDIDLVVHLVPTLQDDNFPEPNLLKDMSRWDSSNIAPGYGLEFPETEVCPASDLFDLATAILCMLDTEQFLAVGPAISDCLWRSDMGGLQQYANEFGVASEGYLESCLKAGGDRRHELKHFLGAMFYYEGEWYWGVGRLYHLEERLRGLRARQNPGSVLIAPRPDIPFVYGDGAKDMTLEYFVSLRSPYTAASWEPTMKVARDSGVNLAIRPVLPMVMRGVPATLVKGLYFWFDAAREARAFGVEQGKFYDSVGEPVLRGYSLYTWAQTQGKGNDFFGAFLKAVFAKGINTNSKSGLKKVVEVAGLQWNEAKHHLDDDSWMAEAEESRLSMYSFGIWGVPSYRLLDADGKEIVSGWGQDRLWLMAQKMRELS